MRSADRRIPIRRTALALALLVAMPAIAKASDLWLANKAEEATKVLIKEIRPAQKKWMAALDQLAGLEDKLNEQVQVELLEAQSRLYQEEQLVRLVHTL